MISYRYSFKGYDVLTALYNNKDLIKTILGIFGTINLLSVDWVVFFTTLGVSVGTLAIKLIIDALDYFFTEVEIPDEIVEVPSIISTNAKLKNIKK